MAKTKRFRDDDDWDIMGQIPSQLGITMIEQLMAGPTQRNHQPYPADVRVAVQKGISKLNPRDRFIIEAVYVWGHSFSEIANMMGYKSKGTPHYALQKAHQNLGAILSQDETIVELLKGNKMATPEYWQDSAWRQIKYLDKSVKVGRFMADTLVTHFTNLAVAVIEGDETRMYDVCWSIGHEAARGLEEVGMWDPEEIADVLASKQHDYGHDNINAFGIIGVAVRLSDKIARYKNLQGKPNRVAGETIVDTLTDMVGYAVLARMLEDGTFQLDLVIEDPF